MSRWASMDMAQGTALVAIEDAAVVADLWARPPSPPMTAAAQSEGCSAVASNKFQGGHYAS